MRASLLRRAADDDIISVYLFFFFSSRRRHTRCLSDWSSDVCSSDLTGWVSAMSVLRLRLVFVLFDFLAPGAGNMRADKAVEQIAGEEQRQDVIQNFLLQNQQAADEQSRDDRS